MNNLNPKQHQAVHAEIGNYLILAGAGSGKTHTLTQRIIYLIDHYNYSINSIMAVTFTNKAAKEMKERIRKNLGYKFYSPLIGTFHSIALNMLKDNYQEAGLKSNFQILDTNDQVGIIKNIMTHLHIDIEANKPKNVASIISSKKEEGIRVRNLNTENPTDKAIYSIYEAYENRCMNESLVDFSELLLRSFELLQNNPSILKRYREEISYILIDEFQDTNTIQYDWVRLLSGSGVLENPIPVIAVGDDDQSIYGWRGAKIKHIQNFENDFTPAQIIKLEQNYRSTNTILKAANSIIKNNDSRLGKELWTENNEGSLIQVYNAANQDNESNYISNKIQNLKEKGFNYSDIAILYRSNAQSRSLEGALGKKSIPYIIFGGIRFFERAEIKDALSYLKLALDSTDNISFNRVINVPARGLGAVSLSRIETIALDNKVSLYEASKIIALDENFNQGIREKLTQFISVIEAIKKSKNVSELNQVIQDVITYAKLEEYYKKDSIRGATKIENLTELISAAYNFQEENINSLEAYETIEEKFLESISLNSSNEEAKQDSVNLMTIHSSKGLEFKNIFIVGFEEDQLPLKSSIAEDNLEEERRLCYVAITRARENLFLTHSNSKFLYNTHKNCIQSRFLNEIPSNLKNISKDPEIRNKYSQSNYSLNNYNSERYNKYSNSERNTYKSKYDNYIQQERDYNDIKSLIKDPSLTKNNKNEEYYVGQKVEHSKFGIGTIIAKEGSQNDLRVQVEFKNKIIKSLKVNLAKLKKI
ncbi:MAG: UvrD-helicase domain-containing protein [Psittacicella sp.]